MMPSRGAADFLPNDSTNIYERHSVESGGDAVIFHSADSNFLNGFSRADALQAKAIANLFDSVHAPISYDMKYAEYFYKCNQEYLGALAKNDDGNFYYIEPVLDEKWKFLCRN